MSGKFVDFGSIEATKSPAWEKPSFKDIEDQNQAIAILAALPPIEYDQFRRPQAKAMRIRISTLDKQVQVHRKEYGISETGDRDDKNGREIVLYEPEPWPELVEGADVLSEALAIIERFMHIRKESAIQCVLWACHAHVFDIFNHSPRLAISAPDAECGKTLLRALIGLMVPRPQYVEIMKAAPFFRMTEKYKPVWLIDECDVFIKEDSHLLAALNNGWEPDGGVVRCIGVDYEPRLFSTFTPVVVCGIRLQKVLPQTTLSRSLFVELERATPEEIPETFDPNVHKSILLDIGKKFARWTFDSREAIRKCNPTMPAGSFNRRADKWKPLFSIAQMAGGDWPELAKKSYFAEVRDSESSSKLSTGLQLLSDIREVLKPHEHVIATTELIERLCDLEESQWTEYNFRESDPERRRVQSRQVSNLLKDYKITPGTIRIGNATPKGYKRAQLEIAWNRYISVYRGSVSATPPQVNNDAASRNFQSATIKNHVAGKKSLKHSNNAGCGGVADRNPLYPGNEDENLDSASGGFEI